MPSIRCCVLSAIGAFLAVTAASPDARAQHYPDYTVRVIVPSTPGGGYDLTGRLLAQQLSERLKGSFIVDNVVGAGTLVGTRTATKPADGYTLLVGGLSNIVFNMGVYAKPGYDSRTAFTPIGLLWSTPYLLVARKDFAPSTVAEVIAAAKAAPGTITVGAAGAGSGQDVMASVFDYLSGAKLNKIQYRGAGPVYTEILGGRLDLFFDVLGTALPQIESGAVKVIATTGAQRDSRLPDLPTMTEAGVPGMALERNSWMGLFAPSGTPQPILDMLRSTTAEVAQSKEMEDKFKALGGRIAYVSAPDTEALVKRETDRWIPLIRKAGVEPQ